MPAEGEVSWTALGTGAHLLVTDAAALPAAEAAVRSVLERVDLAYSRFRDDSEVVALNATAGRQVRVSALLFDAIEIAVRVALATDGAVDPTVGHVLRLLGYDRDFAALPADQAVAPVRIQRVPGWQTIEIDAEQRTVRLAPGVELDLGATGKAFAADLAAAAASSATGAGVLVGLGGDIALAGEAPLDGWPILCADDSRPEATGDGEVITLRADALSTSSTTVRRWIAGGVQRHHIVNPWTGHPADGPWRTATVVAATCVDANAASTAAIVIGERAVAWLEARGLPARLVGHDGRVVRTAGWPAPIGGTSGGPAALRAEVA